jgi:hypothetical protein
MGTVAWVILGAGALLIISVSILIWRGHGPAVRGILTAVWGSTVGKQVILIVVLLFLLQGVKSYSERLAEEKASEWLTSYNGTATTDVVGRISSITTQSSASPSPGSSPSPSPSPSVAPSPVVAQVASDAQPAATNPTPTPNPTPTDAEQKRLDTQLRTVRDRAKHHGTVMAYFYVNYFLSIVMVMGAGLIVAITLFFIAQSGWNGTNSYVRTVFIVASATTAFYGLFPPVFQQQKNITDNKELFLKYKSLESEVESYAVTFTTLKNEPKSAKEFINHVDNEMDRLGNIALGFDVTKISYQEAIDLGEGRRPSPSPSATPPPAGRR